MSFQAYLDTIEKKTGLTPRQLLDLAHERGFDETTKATPIVEWLAQDYALGRGHAMAIPTPGFLSRPGIARLRESAGPIHYAHADLSGYSVFEEAAWWGDRAARRILGG